jgi:hypothetical protein
MSVTTNVDLGDTLGSRATEYAPDVSRFRGGAARYIEINASSGGDASAGLNTLNFRFPAGYLRQSGLLIEKMTAMKNNTDANLVMFGISYIRDGLAVPLYAIQNQGTAATGVRFMLQTDLNFFSDIWIPPIETQVTIILMTGNSDGNSLQLLARCEVWDFSARGKID